MKMKILLVCYCGMSTSLVAEKMKKALKEDEEGSIIEAIPMEKVNDVISNYDVVLIGPQIRFKKGEFEKIAKEHNIPVDTINTMDYGMARGDKIMEQVRKLLKQE